MWYSYILRIYENSEKMNIPYIYKKLADKLENNFNMSLKDFKIVLKYFRITEKDWYKIAKDLELYKIADLNINGNRIKFKKRKAVALFKWYIIFFIIAFSILLFCVAYLLGFLGSLPYL